jgi:hypothetical protein
MNRDQKRLQREIARRQRRKEINREKAEAGFSESTVPKDTDRARVASHDQNNASNLLANRPETRRTLKNLPQKVG